MESMRRIDQGATADLYDLGDGKVLKLFHEDRLDCSIDNEYSCTMKVQDLGLGAPKLYGRVKDERGRGIIMEYVQGQNMLNRLLEDSGHMEYYIKEWVKLQYKINSIHGLDFTSAHEQFDWRIRNNPAITDETRREELLKLLHSLPKKDCLCHTDFQPGNVMITKEGYRIIDWCDTMSDSNWLDTARVMILFEETGTPEQYDVSVAANFREAGRDIYLREYEKLAGQSREELAGWMAVFAAVRLQSEDPQDIPVLERIIDRVL